jgi:hypothetical protein
MRLVKRFPRLMLATACLATASLAYASSPFETVLTAQDGSKLVLNGAGTRYKAVFKVYDMGLYLRTKAATTEAILATPGPKRLNFVALRELSGTDLGMAFMRGVTSNATQTQLNKHLASTTRLIEIFSGKNRLMPGDSFAIEYNPAKGTIFYIDGKAQGAPLGDSEFFEMVLRIWIGATPADWKLKDDLLGLGSAQAS